MTRRRSLVPLLVPTPSPSPQPLCLIPDPNPRTQSPTPPPNLSELHPPFVRRCHPTRESPPHKQLLGRMQLRPFSPDTPRRLAQGASNVCLVRENSTLLRPGTAGMRGSYGRMTTAMRAMSTPLLSPLPSPLGLRRFADTYINMNIYQVPD